MPVGKKNRKEGGLRIFERSLLELKTDAHLEGEDRPGSPVPRPEGTHPKKKSSHQLGHTRKIVPDSLEESSATPDFEPLQTCINEGNLVSNLCKNQGALVDSGKEPLSQDNSKVHKKTEKMDAALKRESDCCDQVIETVSEKDKRGKSKKGRKRERERQRRIEANAKKNQREKKDDLNNRQSLEQSGEDLKGSRKHSSPNQSNPISKTRETGGSSEDKHDSGRRKEEGKEPRSRSNKKRVERLKGKKIHLSPKKIHISSYSNSKHGVSEKSRVYKSKCVGEDWMPELLNLPDVDIVEINDEHNVWEKEAQNEVPCEAEEHISCELRHTETASKEIIYLSCEEKCSRSTSCKGSCEEEEKKDGNIFLDSIILVKGQSESQEAPQDTAFLVDSKLCLEKKRQTDLHMHISLESIEEQSKSSSWKEMEVGTINPKSDVEGIEVTENNFFSDCWIEKEQNEVQSKHKEYTKIYEITVAQHQGEGNISEKICEERGTTESGDFRNEGNVKESDHHGNMDADHFEEMVSNKEKYLDYFKGVEYTSTQAAGDSEFFGSTCSLSSLENRLRCEDMEENSDTYHNLLKNRIVALEGRISAKPCFGPRGLSRGNRNRGRLRHDPSPYQLYLKAIQSKNEKEDDHCVNICSAVTATKFWEKDKDINSKSVISGEDEEKLLLNNIVLHPEQGLLDSGSIKISPKAGVGNWPCKPPGFFTNPHPMIGPCLSSSDSWFGEKVTNGTKTEERNADSEKIINNTIEIHTLLKDRHAITKQKELFINEDAAEKLVFEGENWEDSLYDVELLMGKTQTSNAAAVVPNDSVLCERFNDESDLEQYVPEDNEASNSSMDSVSNLQPSSSRFNSQNTLSGVPTISEDENSSVRDEESNSQQECSLGNGIQQNIFKVVLKESSEKSNLKTDKEKLNKKIEGASKPSDIIFESRGNYNSGLKCQCSPDFVQFWLWRSCLCQAPYLCNIKRGIEGYSMSTRTGKFSSNLAHHLVI